MASRVVNFTRFPDAPETYTQAHMDDLIRALGVFADIVQNPGEDRATKIVFTDMPTSDSGLEAGTLFRIGNDVKISLLDTAVPDSASATASLGSVTVSVS